MKLNIDMGKALGIAGTVLSITAGLVTSIATQKSKEAEYAKMKEDIIKDLTAPKES